MTELTIGALAPDFTLAVRRSPPRAWTTARTHAVEIVAAALARVPEGAAAS